MKPDDHIFIAGHKGMVGSSVLRKLQGTGYEKLLLRDRHQLDLLDQQAVKQFFKQERIDYVIVAAAKVGGIQANIQHQAEFLYENLTIASNLIEAAYRSNVQKLLYLGSSCIYPKDCPQPIKESYLLTGPLEETNEGYAIAKIAGLKLCQWYHRQFGIRCISVMPTNLYGPGDNFHPEHSHVLPGLMARFHQAKMSGDRQVIVWGDGSQLRDILHVDDLAEAVFHLMLNYESSELINVGSGEEHTIAELAEMIKTVVGFGGDIIFDSSKPTGMLRKVLDVEKITAIGWQPKIPLEQGLAEVYQWAVKNNAV